MYGGYNTNSVFQISALYVAEWPVPRVALIGDDEGNKLTAELFLMRLYICYITCFCVAAPLTIHVILNCRLF
jgi:hypothetical protein